MILRSLLFLSLLFSPIAQARMYQWTDPESGTTQLSGKPPTWYRSSAGGPRVFVIERGQVIDDTAIKVSNEQRDLLRQRAFLKIEEDKTVAAEKALAARKLKAALAIEADDEMVLEQQADEPEEIIEEVITETDEMKKEADAITAEEMRTKIEDWERERTEEAKKLLEPDT